MDASLKDVLEITPFPCVSKDPSKSQGGSGSIIPLKGEYPRDKKGRLMVFLAQINKEEFPLPWKSQGILQFYVSQDNLKDPSLEEDFKIVAINQSDPITYHQIANFSTHGFVFLETPYNLHFSKKRTPFPSCDHGFKDIYDEILKTTYELDGLDNFFKEYGKRTDHRIGGYPSFRKKTSRGHLLLHLALGHDLYHGGDIWISFFSQELDAIHDVDCHIFGHSFKR